MGYGLQVENGDNDLIIDSEQPYSSFGILSSGTGTLNSSGTPVVAHQNIPTSYAPLNRSFYRQNYPTQITGNDMFFVKLAADGWVAEELGLNSLFGSSHKWIHGGPTAGTYAYKEIDVMSHSSMTIPNWNSTYGLNVFKEYTGTPQQSDLIFSSVAEQGLNIVAVGTYKDLANSNQTFQTITINSTDPHYVLVNGSGTYPGALTYVQHMGYWFTYSTSNTDLLTSITVYALNSRGWGNPQPLSTWQQGQYNSWMILKITG